LKERLTLGLASTGACSGADFPLYVDTPSCKLRHLSTQCVSYIEGCLYDLSCATLADLMCRQPLGAAAQQQIAPPSHPLADAMELRNTVSPLGWYTATNEQMILYRRQCCARIKRTPKPRHKLQYRQRRRRRQHQQQRTATTLTGSGASVPKHAVDGGDDNAVSSAVTGRVSMYSGKAHSPDRDSSSSLRRLRPHHCANASSRTSQNTWPAMIM
jgi:hypothetical protein